MWLRAMSIVASMRRGDSRREGTRFALRRLQLHEDGGKPLGEVVVNVARQAIPFLENGLAAFFHASLLGKPALMQRQRGLAGNGLEHRDRPLKLAIRGRTGRDANPPQVSIAEHERTDGE